MSNSFVEARTSKAALAGLGSGFASATAHVNGTSLHYVRGGSGPAILLIHGFPQDWSEFRAVMPKLAEKFTVVALDLPGIGGSGVPESSYENASTANDIEALVRHLKLENVFVVGHDLGGGKAYAYARKYSSSIRGVMILDVPIAGLEPWEAIKLSPRVWHFEFHQQPNELAEILIAGRQVPYFGEFFTSNTVNPDSITEADTERFAEAYSKPESLHAGMEYYRAFPADEKFNASLTEKFDLPIILAGGDQSFGALLPLVAEDLKKHGCTNVHVETVTNSGHYVVEEQPEQVIALIERYEGAASKA